MKQHKRATQCPVCPKDYRAPVWWYWHDGAVLMRTCKKCGVVEVAPEVERRALEHTGPTTVLMAGSHQHSWEGAK